MILAEEIVQWFREVDKETLNQMEEGDLMIVKNNKGEEDLVEFTKELYQEYLSYDFDSAFLSGTDVDNLLSGEKVLTKRFYLTENGFLMDVDDNLLVCTKKTDGSTLWNPKYDLMKEAQEKKK